jgi:hypothetical protein
MDSVFDYIIQQDKMYLFDKDYQIIIENYDIFNIEKLKELHEGFLKIKEIECLLLKDLKRIRGEFCEKSSNVIYSIKILEFELIDIAKYSPTSINEKYVSHLNNLKELLENSNYKEYINSIPSYSRVYKFVEFTRKPKKGTLSFHYKNGRELWELDDKNYWEFVRYLWKEYSDNVFSKRHIWYEIFGCERNNRNYFMTHEERLYLDSLPDEIEIYRGYLRDKPTDKMEPENLKWWEFQSLGDMGYSYTLSKEVGIKYSEKYKKYNRDIPGINYYRVENELFHGSVLKSDVLFYFNGKNEEEIILVEEGGKYSSFY